MSAHNTCLNMSLNMSECALSLSLCLSLSQPMWQRHQSNHPETLTSDCQLK